jgi:hypothetical protein
VNQASSPFHKRYSRAKFAVLRHANLRFAWRNAYFLRLSKIAVPITDSDWNVSAPGGAQGRSGADAAKKSFKGNKKPGDERRADPSICLGSCSARPGTDVLEARFLSIRCS